MGDKHYIDFGQNVIGTLELKDDLIVEENFEEEIQEFSEKINSILVNINSEDSFGQILNIDSTKFDFEADYNSHEFTSGAILFGLDSIDKNIYATKSTIGLVMKNENFSPIIGTTKAGESIFVINGSLNSIFGNFFKKNDGIINNLVTNLENLGIYPSNFGKIHIGPSNKKNLKITYLEYLALIKNISHKYNHIEFDSFFEFVSKDYGIVNLNGLIDTILRSHGFSMYEIQNAESSNDSICYNQELTEKKDQTYISTIAKII